MVFDPTGENLADPDARGRTTLDRDALFSPAGADGTIPHEKASSPGLVGHGFRIAYHQGDVSKVF